MAQEMLNDKLAEIYFFAQDKDFAPYYDLVEDLLNPHLKITHDLMIDLVIESINRNRRTTINEPAVLVVGSGTGGEVLRIVRKLPLARIVAIDFSPPMNAQLREKYTAEFSGLEFDSNIDLLEFDFLSERCAPDSLVSGLYKKFGMHEFDAVVIGFVTHHYSPEQKLEFYRRVRAVLCKGGSLIHGDLFNYNSEWLSRLAHAVGEKWIEQLVDPDAKARNQWIKIQHIASRLCAAWIRHWNGTHIYSLMNNDSGGSSDAFPSHASALRELGFSEVECPLRLWEVGVIWARL
jgi:SAM-dependent methyltransferase